MENCQKIGSGKVWNWILERKVALWEGENEKFSFLIRNLYTNMFLSGRNWEYFSLYNCLRNIWWIYSTFVGTLLEEICFCVYGKFNLNSNVDLYKEALNEIVQVLASLGCTRIVRYAHLYYNFISVNFAIFPL